MWQFMPRTGREYMRVTRSIDERRDPLESTRAAAGYLKQAYDLLGNWPLAITSYNYGRAGIARAVAEVGSDHLVTLIENYVHPYFGYAPKNFYAEFLIAVDIGRNVERYFPGLDLDRPVPLREIELDRGTSLAAVSRATGLSQNQLLGWNPALSSRPGVIPAGYRVKVPADIKNAPVVQVAAAARPEPQPKSKIASRRSEPQVKTVRHRVKRGETLIEIAERYGASVERIVRANRLRRANAVRAGTTLLIPRF
jgi:membrane-bound lytic murein transglycosylase D